MTSRSEGLEDGVFNFDFSVFHDGKLIKHQRSSTSLRHFTLCCQIHLKNVPRATGSSLKQSCVFFVGIFPGASSLPPYLLFSAKAWMLPGEHESSPSLLGFPHGVAHGSWWHHGVSSQKGPRKEISRGKQPTNLLEPSSTSLAADSSTMKQEKEDHNLSHV